MKYKTLFRMGLRLIGVLVVAGGCGDFLFYLFGIVIDFSSGSSSYVHWIRGITAHAIQMAVGIYLILGGKWIVNKAIPSNRPYCHECGYDLTAATGHLCNECGTPFKSELPTPELSKPELSKSPS